MLKQKIIKTVIIITITGNCFIHCSSKSIIHEKIIKLPGITMIISENINGKNNSPGLTLTEKMFLEKVKKYELKFTNSKIADNLKKLLKNRLSDITTGKINKRDRKLIRDNTGSGILIIGKAIVTDPVALKPGTKMKGAVIRLRALDIESGKVLAAISRFGTGISTSDEMAVTTAISSAIGRIFGHLQKKADKLNYGPFLTAMANSWTPVDISGKAGIHMAVMISETINGRKSAEGFSETGIFIQEKMISMGFIFNDLNMIKAIEGKGENDQVDIIITGTTESIIYPVPGMPVNNKFISNKAVIDLSAISVKKTNVLAKVKNNARAAHIYPDIASSLSIKKALEKIIGDGDDKKGNFNPGNFIKKIESRI